MADVELVGTEVVEDVDVGVTIETAVTVEAVVASEVEPVVVVVEAEATVVVTAVVEAVAITVVAVGAVAAKLGAELTSVDCTETESGTEAVLEVKFVGAVTVGTLGPVEAVVAVLVTPGVLVVMSVFAVVVL